MAKLRYKRILLKLSGEVLGGESGSGIDAKVLETLAKEIKKVQALGCQVGVVIGGGNIWRYRDFKSLNFSRVVSDQMGMMATVMNTMSLAEALKQNAVKVKAVSSFECEKALETHVIKNSSSYLDQGYVVIFGGGTGSPFFTTDSSAALRALEMNCDVLLKATKVDYVYDKDPVKYKDAKKFSKLSFQDVIEKGLGVMDLTCAALCKEGSLPMVVFNLSKKDNVLKVVKGENVGTLVN